MDRRISLTFICSCRSVRQEEPMWGEDEDFSEHDYYNSIPGKEPPVGGVVDSRLRSSGALLGHIHTQPQSKTAAQVSVLVWFWKRIWCDSFLYWTGFYATLYCFSATFHLSFSQFDICVTAVESQNLIRMI